MEMSFIDVLALVGINSGINLSIIYYWLKSHDKKISGLEKKMTFVIVCMKWCVKGFKERWKSLLNGDDEC